MKKNRYMMLAIMLLMAVASTACNSELVHLYNQFTGSNHTTESARSTCLQVAGDPGDPGGACERIAFRVALKQAWPWLEDMERVTGRMNCIARHETNGHANPYKAENGGTRYVEGPGRSTASGRYQYVDGTWRRHLALAEAHYRREISNASHAADADPWMQDAVVTYSIVVKGADDWAWGC